MNQKSLFSKIELNLGLELTLMSSLRTQTLHCEIKSVNKGYFRLRILSRPDLQDIYCNILQECIPLITDLNSMRLKCYS